MMMMKMTHAERKQRRSHDAHWVEPFRCLACRGGKLSCHGSRYNGRLFCNSGLRSRRRERRRVNK